MSEQVATHTNFTLKRLDELSGMTFFVEVYQRGYKWDVQQVLNLLNDINEFKGVGSQFYCLQPVVVKKIKPEDERIREKKNLAETDNVYELIDGQQRLTTVFIILSLLAKEQLPFELIYRTRPESETFIKSISSLLPVPFSLNPENVPAINGLLNASWKTYSQENPDKDNVDNYHFFKACQLIHQWSQGKEISSFVKKLLYHVKVIWYTIQKEAGPGEDQAVTKNAEKVFINFNQGRIQLEQAELIKALFVIKYKEIVNSETSSMRINLFSEEWNRIESQLQDDRFWYFVSNDTSEKKRYNRIDLLFDLLSENPQKAEDNLFAYHFYLKSNNSIDQAIENWKQLKNLFELLKEWYEDRLLYHLIGITVYLRIQVIPCLITSYKNKNKTAFVRDLKSKISEKLTKPEYEIAKLDYRTPEETKAILHIFNISTYHISDFNYRFPFDKLKTQTWSLEHIHAQNAKKFTNKQEFIDWLEDVRPLLIDLNDQTRLKTLEALMKELNKQELSQVLNKLSPFYEDLNTALNMDNISNLCLLDRNTNSSLGNHTFRQKREMVLKIDGIGEVELEGKKHKVFIPICTKNVFLKYYVTGPAQFTYWGKQDREGYLACIENQLSNFLSNA